MCAWGAEYDAPLRTGSISTTSAATRTAAVKGALLAGKQALLASGGNALAAAVAAGYRNAIAVGVAILLDNKYSGRTASNAAIHRDAVGERLGAADRLASGRDTDLGVVRDDIARLSGRDTYFGVVRDDIARLSGRDTDLGVVRDDIVCLSGRDADLGVVRCDIVCLGGRDARKTSTRRGDTSLRIHCDTSIRVASCCSYRRHC